MLSVDLFWCVGASIYIALPIRRWGCSESQARNDYGRVLKPSRHRPTSDGFHDCSVPYMQLTCTFKPPSHTFQVSISHVHLEKPVARYQYYIHGQLFHFSRDSFHISRESFHISHESFHISHESFHISHDSFHISRDVSNVSNVSFYRELRVPLGAKPEKLPQLHLTDSHKMSSSQQFSDSTPRVQLYDEVGCPKHTTDLFRSASN